MQYNTVTWQHILHILVMLKEVTLDPVNPTKRLAEAELQKEA